MKLGYTTIITSIRSCQAGALKQYLQEHVAPRFDPAKIIECQNSFPFDQIKGLHFCSLLIIHEADGSDPRLVFEATFDGLREEFVDDLLRVASQWIHKIYERCEGYPKSGLAVPELIKSYLLANDAGVQTFFAGSPGRCVAQIKGEQRVHDEIVSFVSRRRSTKEAPTTFLGIQRELQHEVIRNRPANHWAEQPAAVPWEVSQRRGVLAAVVLAVSVVACWLGAGVLRWYGLRPTGVYDTIDILLRNAVEFGEKILSPEIIGPLIADLLNVLRVPILPPLMSLTVAWFCLRVVQLLLERDNPRDAFFLIRFVVHISVILRYAVLAFLAGFAVLLFDKRLVQTPGAPMWWHTLVYLCAVAVSLLLLKYFATTLKLVIQFQGLSPAAENVRRFLLDVVRFLMVILVIWVFVVLGLHIPAYITAVIGDFVFPGTKILLVVTIYVVVGILIFYCLAFLFFLLVRCLEFMDRIRFAPATDLPNRATASVFEREEGGVNKYQNHLASLTYVKPGFLRRWLLRSTLFVIWLLARFWFNQGTLGGIPTILSARWVLIDRGRRLLFFSNYAGGWDSYLNEFIDMGAVTGLNAIWTNTFLKTDTSGRRYAFPATKYYLWRGAENEQPFKSYVRQSQIETIVWYSAYPTLTIMNINTNTDLRQALFTPLAPFELDSVFLKAGL